MAVENLTAARLREVLHYEPATGVFTWRARTGVRSKTRIGTIAGSKAKHGRTSYLTIQIDGQRYYAHRLAWLYMTGEWPADEVDHERGDGLDNRWSKLRAATSATNKENQRAAKSNSSTGLLGVFRREMKTPQGKPFFSQIVASGRQKYLGAFCTADEAHAAYVDAKRRLHTGCTL